ncbi:LytTR family DNA-binding domain-containing protein [Pedobacter sp. ASV28]|uniref:LytR/AlgR family response regulator transcription factor n=1 Tax=Pedobacter sp. ASV28 TaxID=2795123 RepID=UPI0018EC3058|nr:LytTR family DNA-binding domain-containing protein [Pedobacter sp. ASV28]
MEISCIVIDDEPHAVSELTDLIGMVPGIYLLNSFENVKDAVSYLSSHKTVDVIFSDIEMPTLNGISAAKILHQYCDYLIYVTAHRNFALDAFDENAAGYLLKPISQHTMVNQVMKLREHLKKRVNSQTEGMVFIKGGNKNTFIKLEWDKVIYVKALLNYVNIHTSKGDEVTYIGLKLLAELIKKQDHFFRISKSVIVNLNYIERVEGNMVRLMNDNTFTIGDKYRNAFHEFLRKRTLRP